VALLDIHVLGSPVLREPTKPVERVTDDLRRLVDDMFETMHAAKGIGLAAPQVGRLERLFVAEVDEVRVAIFNPEIVDATGKPVKAEEGCLSIPDIYGDVERPPVVTVRGLDPNGQPLELEASDLLGRCFQHEIDHLHGRLFIDYFSMFKKRSAMAAWEREKAKYPALRRTLVAAKDLAEQHNEEAL
jgi:peptide deformylase